MIAFHTMHAFRIARISHRVVNRSLGMTNNVRLTLGLLLCSIGFILIIATKGATGVFIQEAKTFRAEDSCVERCMETPNSSLPCSCDDRCASFDNCCDDYVETCLNNSQSSCFGRCFDVYGFIPDQTCYCDDQCSKYGNCCDDFLEQCANASLCENRCFVWYSGSLPCQCNDQCPSYGNCCEDYYPNCLPGSCQSRCGDRNSSIECQCDFQCSDKNDCCEDFLDTCTTDDSCELICGIDYDENRPCQCNNDCDKYGNCCEDYKSQCAELYLCNGACDVKKGACSCMPECLSDNTCCTDYAQSCQGHTSWLDDECTPESEMTCPNGFDKPPVILFSMDGFRNSYLYRDETPNLWKLASCGVHSPYTRSIYPTKTFPNHYTIVTGLYPESHGIVANRFYDHELEDEFQLGGDTADDPQWWGGEPIWVTASNQGQISASYFWVGSDVNITRYPDYYVPFDSSVPDEERVYQVLKWLDLPPKERPSIITMYIEEVDGAGHDVGPDGHEVDVEIAKADHIAGMLMDGLKARNLDKCVNLVFLADHGMGNITCDKLTYVDQYGVDLDVVYFRGGAGGRIGKSKDQTEWNQFDPYDINDKLQCKRNETHFQSFLKFENLPKRLHYAYNDRIDDVIILSDDDWLLGGKTGTYTSCNGGTHGWDNENKQMRAMFVAHGASFRRAYNTSEPFDNFEIYNMLCDMLDLNPAANNGTKGSLNHLLKNPKAVSPSSSDETPMVCSYPPDSDEATERLGCTNCGDEAQWNRVLNFNPDQISQSQTANMLMGVPQIFTASEGEAVNYCLLTQADYVTAYSWEKSMPYYSSFVLDKKLGDLSGVSICVRPDIRLDPQHSAYCSDFANNQDVTWAYLFDPGFSTSDKTQGTILSNVVPVYRGFFPIWEHFSLILDDWAGSYNGISVVAGPVFDYNFDGHADSADILDKNAMFVRSGDKSSSPIPTHIFVVITKCRDEYSGEGIRSCATSPNKIAVLSFVIPNYKEQPCTYDLPMRLWVPQTLYQHVTRVRDVELLTGISFFPDWIADQNTIVSALRVKVHLPEFGSPWLQDFLTAPAPDTAAVATSSKLLVFASVFLVIFMKSFLE